jgi:hypothetical protein
MNSDNFEMAKSSAPQSISDYTAFSEKSWGQKYDINNGVYQASLPVVEFDLNSIYKSDQFTNTEDLFIVTPIVMSAICSDAAGTTTYAAPTAGYSVMALKNNYQNLVHQIDVTLDGKTLHDNQSFTNVYSNFKLLSSMNANDLLCNNTGLGLAPELDNEKSMKFVTTPANLTSGVGLVNNLCFENGAAGSGSCQPNISQNGQQFNKAIFNRMNRIVDTTANNANGIYGGAKVVTESNLKSDFKPYYTVASDGKTMYWFDYSIINLKYLVDSLAQIGIVRRLNLRLRVTYNMGSVQMVINTPGVAATQNYTSFSHTFGGSCPFTLNWLPLAAAAGGFNAAAVSLHACISLVKPATSINNVAITQVSHPLSSCRIYYSNIKLANDIATKYVTENRAKQVIYERIIFSSDNNIGVGGTQQKTICASVKYPIGLLCVPLLSKSGTGGAITAALGFSQYESPWDTCPATVAPIALTNVIVQLGGTSVTGTAMNYSFENFMQQVAIAESLTSADAGLSVGLINQAFWESNRYYWFDLSRSRDADKVTGRDLTISYTNSSNVPIDCLYYVAYLDKMTIDVETGIVEKI